MAKQMTLDQDYIDCYSKDFSKRICDNHFTNKKNQWARDYRIKRFYSTKPNGN